MAAVVAPLVPGLVRRGVSLGATDHDIGRGEPSWAAVCAGLATLLDGEQERRKTYTLKQLFPDCTPACANPKSLKRRDHGRLCRRLYRKHVAWMTAGVDYPERLLMAANRVGKTKTAAYEVTCHLTGLYPPWWRGRRFAAAGAWWAVGKSSTATRDIVQLELLGPGHALGAGLIPPHTLMGRPTMRSGATGAVDTALVRHASGGIATLTFKSYDQRRKAFEGTKKQGVWLDEEPPEDVAEECAMRTMGIDGEEGGLTMVTFTPLQGITPYVQAWLDGGDLFTADGTIVPARQLLGMPAEG